MTNYYVRETPDGADVLNRISVTLSALVCTCYEVSTAQQIVNALNAQAPPAAVPAGYALVPVEPTQAMLDAAGMSIVLAGKEWLDQSNREVWASMLAAANKENTNG